MKNKEQNYKIYTNDKGDVAMNNTERKGIFVRIIEFFSRYKRKALPSADGNLASVNCNISETEDYIDGVAIEEEQFKERYIRELGMDVSVLSLPGAKKYIYTHPICKDIVDKVSFKDAKKQINDKYGIIKTECDGVKKVKIVSNEGKEAICIDTSDSGTIIGTIVPEHDGMIKENRLYNSGIEMMRQITHYQEIQEGNPVAYLQDAYSRASVGIAKNEIFNEWIDLSVGDGDIGTLDNVVGNSKGIYNPNEDKCVREERVNGKINSSVVSDALKQVYHLEQYS